MYLRTPKRYTEKGRRRNPINLRWLWLYILAPIILIPAVLVWDYRDTLRPTIIGMIPTVVINPPTPTATIAAPKYAELMANAFQSGDIAQAITLLKTYTMDVTPNEIAFHSLLGQLIVLRAYGGDPAKLADAYQVAYHAINANPEKADGWITMALVLDWSSKPQEALPYALRAKDLDEKSLMVQAVLAEIYHDLQKDDLASKLVTDAINSAKSDPNVNRAALAHAYYVRGLILQTTAADGKEAIAAYEAAWRTATSDPPDTTIPSGYIAQLLAVLYRNTQQTDKAIQMLTKAIERDKTDPLLQFELGRSYVNNGDAEKGRNYVETCRDMDPTQIKCLRWLGIYAYQQQNYNKSIEMMQKVLDLDSKNTDAHLYMGRAYGALNQCSAAIETLQRGLPFVKEAKARADFEDALRACGSSSGISIETPSTSDVATEQPTQPAKPTRTPTPKKR